MLSPLNLRHCPRRKVGAGRGFRYKAIVVRYEDILSSPDSELNKIYVFLGVEPRDLPEVLDPGVYPKYVGKMIDPARDQLNYDATTEDERAEIKDRLSDFFSRFYPEEI